jgi:hypothetical protein
MVEAQLQAQLELVFVLAGGALSTTCAPSITGPITVSPASH